MPSRASPQSISGAYGEILIAPDTGGRSPPHFHTTYAIGVTRSGGGTVFALGRRWSHSTGMIVVTNPFDSHWGRSSAGGLSYSLFYPRLSWLASLPGLRDLPDLLHFDRAVLEDSGLAARLAAGCDGVVASGDESLLAAAVADLFCRYASMAPSAEAKAERAFPRHELIADVAAGAGFSRAYYSRRHRRLTGLSPLDHRRQARVLAARSMIEAGAALADAAADAGFADQSHMTRQFRQVLGVTPSAYRPR